MAIDNPNWDYRLVEQNSSAVTLNASSSFTVLDTSASFTVATAADANTFTVTAASSATNSGNVSITLSGAKLFVCESWSKSIPYNNRASISATFRQVFEP